MNVKETKVCKATFALNFLQDLGLSYGTMQLVNETNQLGLGGG